MISGEDQWPIEKRKGDDMSDEDLRSRIGRSVGIRTLIQLVIASVVVGAIFSFIGVSPREFWSGIYDTFQGIISSLGESFAEVVITIIQYLVIGAAIVIPIWLISRLLGSGK